LLTKAMSANPVVTKPGDVKALVDGAAHAIALTEKIKAQSSGKVSAQALSVLGRTVVHTNHRPYQGRENEIPYLQAIEIAGALAASNDTEWYEMLYGAAATPHPRYRAELLGFWEDSGAARGLPGWIPLLIRWDRTLDSPDTRAAEGGTGGLVASWPGKPGRKSTDRSHSNRFG
jgi:hypothetical protein